ncbi:MAG: hypothetical protein ABIT07_10820 [Ferruginibacter sp.]
MKYRILKLSVFVLLVLLYSCHKKIYPEVNETSKNNSASTTGNTTTLPAKNTTPVSAKVYLKEKAKKGGEAPPTVIVVNDKAAGKTLDGKYYYELNGYRYWKNKKDGKYYLNGIFTSKTKKN